MKTTLPQKNPIYRPRTAGLSVETIRNPTVTYITSEFIRPLLHNCGCVTIKLRGVEAVATVHMDRKLEHCDLRDSIILSRSVVQFPVQANSRAADVSKVADVCRVHTQSITLYERDGC